MTNTPRALVTTITPIAGWPRWFGATEYEFSCARAWGMPVRECATGYEVQLATEAQLERFSEYFQP